MKKYKVLLVEDDISLSRMYITRLEMENDIEVQHVPSAVQAVEIILAQEVDLDLVLLDVLLPDNNGFWVVHECLRKKEQELIQVPIIMLTNVAAKEKVDRAIRDAIYDYLVKAHYSPTEVIDHIKSILRRMYK